MGLKGSGEGKTNVSSMKGKKGKQRRERVSPPSSTLLDPKNDSKNYSLSHGVELLLLLVSFFVDSFPSSLTFDPVFGGKKEEKEEESQFPFDDDATRSKTKWTHCVPKPRGVRPSWPRPQSK